MAAVEAKAHGKKTLSQLTTNQRHYIMKRVSIHICKHNTLVRYLYCLNIHQSYSITSTQVIDVCPELKGNEVKIDQVLRMLLIQAKQYLKRKVIL